MSLMVCSHYPIPRPVRKMGCIELCGGVHTTQKQTSTQIPIEFCVNLLVCLYVSLGDKSRIFLLVMG